jgi:hypothetical protein
MELIIAKLNLRVYRYSTYQEAQRFRDYMFKNGFTAWKIDSYTRSITLYGA